MKTILISRLVRTIPLLGVSILLLSQALAGPLDNWTTKQISTNWFGFNCVAYGNGRYVAYGGYLDSGGIMTSEDGMNWVPRLDGRTNGLSFSVRLIHTGNRFFALGGFGSSGVSTNGIDWTVLSHGINWGVTYFSSVAYGNGRYVIAGYAGAYRSTDGVSWGKTLPQGVADIAFGAGKFVALGAGQIYTSVTTTTWTNHPIPGSSSRISFCNGIFIVPYGPGTNLLSSDGISWATVNTGIPGLLDGKINFANGLFMTRLGAYLATSTDGTNWFQHPQALPGVDSHFGGDIATDGKRLVAVRNSFVDYSDLLVDLYITNTSPPQVVISGLAGRKYRLDYADALTNSANINWQTLINLQLPVTPYVFTDTTATNSQRFYRGVLLP